MNGLHTKRIPRGPAVVRTEASDASLPRQSEAFVGRKRRAESIARRTLETDRPPAPVRLSSLVSLRWIAGLHLVD